MIHRLAAEVERLRLVVCDQVSELGEELERTPIATCDNAPQWDTTPGEGSEQGGCTLTDAEREAIRRAAAVADEMHDSRLKAALHGLLERTKTGGM